MKTNLLNYNCSRLEGFFTDMGEAAFHGRQVFKWVHQHGMTDFNAMTNLSKKLREKIEPLAYVEPPEISYEKKSQDGTIKWLMKLTDGNCIETVYIPEEGRGTLCVSSQVGCALNCSFCSTGHQGYNRDLSTAEIIGQVWLAVRQLSKEQGKHDRQVTNVVMMGMGEPLLNYNNVLAAMDIMLDDLAYGLSKYRVTLSTSGIVPAMYDLAKDSPVALAVSLHAPNDELRTELVPINKKYPIKVLMDACRHFFKDEPKRYITMEYVMLDGINDQPQHAKQLIKILQGVSAKVNLIPFNSFPATQYQRSSDAAINTFRNILIRAGLNTVTRKTRGDDIDAACGQLVGKVDGHTRSFPPNKNKITTFK